MGMKTTKVRSGDIIDRITTAVRLVFIGWLLVFGLGFGTWSLLRWLGMPEEGSYVLAFVVPIISALLIIAIASDSKSERWKL